MEKDGERKRVDGEFIKHAFSSTCSHTYPHRVGSDAERSFFYTKRTFRELSGRVLESRPKGRGFEPHRRHCVAILEQDTFILA